eukprot:GDKK01006219.1.p2 GENE.GDKK01006219.1~~GDKK01006219.1.p2  ORF type:complete len:108 (+),score=5.57 GDKK01006219.1:431-754(+)
MDSIGSASIIITTSVEESSSPSSNMGNSTTPPKASSTLPDSGEGRSSSSAAGGTLTIETTLGNVTSNARARANGIRIFDKATSIVIGATSEEVRPASEGVSSLITVK